MRTALFHHFKKPVMIVEGKMQYLFDEAGRRYLDVSSSPLISACTAVVTYKAGWCSFKLRSESAGAYLKLNNEPHAKQ